MASHPRNYDLNRMQVLLAKEFARAQGYKGAQGGWIYLAATGDTVCQGWSTFYQRYEHKILDWLTSSLTGFTSFSDMVWAKGDYRPTMHLDANWRLVFLAVNYNRSQAVRNDPRRVYVGTWPKNFPNWLRSELKETSC